MNKIIRDMIPIKHKPPLREAIPVEREEIPFKEKIKKIREPRIKKTNNGIIGTRSVKPWTFGIIALVCVLAIAYAFSIVYARATVVITPATIDIPIDGSYNAYLNSTASNTIAYQIIQTSGELQQQIPATIGPVVITSAKGTVIMYNNYSSASQKIVAGTRLSSGNGLIYTTNNTISIPGVSKGVAGSVPVAVTASVGGSSYNIATSDLITNPSYGDFKILAYKDGPKYTGFYGRLNPNGAGITGGSSGHQIIVSSSTVASANQTMEQTLQKNLFSQAQTLVPAGYVLINNAYNIIYTPISASSTSSTTANIGMEGSLSAVVLQKANLAKVISSTQYNSSFDPQDLESAQFTITNPQTFSYTNGAILNFSLIGNMNLVGIVPTSTLATQLAGLSSTAGTAVLKGYSAIGTIHATMFPFWKHSFPSSASRISIVIQK